MRKLKGGVADRPTLRNSIIPTVLIAGVVIAVVCAVRGAVMSLVFHRSFLGEFVYPMIIIAFAELATVPFCIAEKFIAPMEKAPHPTMKLWHIPIVVIGIIAVVLALLFGSVASAERIFILMLGNEAPLMIVSRFWWLSLLPVVYLPLLTAYFFIPGGVMGRFSAYLLPCRKKIVLFCCSVVLCLALTLPIYSSYYTIAPDGVASQTAAHRMEYPWEEVSEAVVQARRGVLTVELHTKDGKKFPLMSDAVYNNDKFEEIYPGGTEDFTAEILKILAEQGTSVSEQADIELKLEYDYWIEYLHRIREIYL